MIVTAPISLGELVDKITILEIKLALIPDESKLQNIRTELTHLTDTLNALDIPDISILKSALAQVNQELWHIENYKRACEQEQNFSDGFINAARQVYLKNDQRARIKKQINELTGSTIREEKSY